MGKDTEILLTLSLPFLPIINLLYLQHMPTINRQQRGNAKRGEHQGRRFYHAGYHTGSWKGLRREILQDNPLCVECQKSGRIVVANVIDHIKPVRLGGEFYDKANLQPLCKSCHERKSAHERHVNPVVPSEYENK